MAISRELSAAKLAVGVTLQSESVWSHACHHDPFTSTHAHDINRSFTDIEQEISCCTAISVCFCPAGSPLTCACLPFVVCVSSPVHPSPMPRTLTARCPLLPSPWAWFHLTWRRVSLKMIRFEETGPSLPVYSQHSRPGSAKTTRRRPGHKI